MNTRLLNFEKYDVNELIYDNPKPIRGSAFLAKISGDRILFQTPILKNISGIEQDSKGCNIELELDDTDVPFTNFLRKIDEFNVKYTFENSTAWFNDNLPYEIIDDFYIPTIKNKNVKVDNSNDTKSINYIKCRIPTSKKIPDINIYNNKRELIDWKRIEPYTDTVALMELKGLKFLNNELICDWEIQQLKATVNKSNINLTSILNIKHKDPHIEQNVNDNKERNDHDTVSSSTSVNQEDDGNIDNEELKNNDGNIDIQKPDEVLQIETSPSKNMDNYHYDENDVNNETIVKVDVNNREKSVSSHNNKNYQDNKPDKDNQINENDIYDENAHPDNEDIPQSNDYYDRYNYNGRKSGKKIKDLDKPENQELNNKRKMRKNNQYNIIDEDRIKELAESNYGTEKNISEYIITEKKRDLTKTRKEADNALRIANVLKLRADEAESEITKMEDSIYKNRDNIINESKNGRLYI